MFAASVKMSECYYLSTSSDSPCISVRKYSDNSIVKTCQDDAWKDSSIYLIGITDSLVIVYLQVLRKAFVYSFDCCDPDSLKYCYPFDYDGHIIETRHRYQLGNKLIFVQRNSSEYNSILHVCWAFTDVGYKKIAEWTLPIEWTYSEVIKLSNHQLLSICTRGPSPVFHLTTVDTVDRVDKFTSSVIQLHDLDKLGVGVLSEIAQRFYNLKYYPDHQLIFASSAIACVLYQRQHKTWKMIQSRQLCEMKSTNIINGELKMIQYGVDGYSFTFPDLQLTSKIEALSCFYAYPSKRKIEQLYLPTLLPVLKGCRDLALLVVSYLEWDNDIAN